MIAEYERAKVLERSRRGKRHQAQQRSVSVMSRAPYGYRYVTVAKGAGHARYEVDIAKAQVVRRIFDWVGRERLSLCEVCRHLADDAIPSPAGKARWDRRTIWNMLKNTAYCGQAAYGRTRVGAPRPRQCARREKTLSSLTARVVCNVPADEWLSIPVPALVSEALFESVQTQLEENRQRLRSWQQPVTYLLQGLLVCGCCGYAYCGMTARGAGPREYTYYRCAGHNHFYQRGDQQLCWNKPIRSDELEGVVWDQVCQLLQDPRRLANEYQRRLNAVQVLPATADVNLPEQQIAKVRNGIARLIDGYAEGYLEKSETEPRIRHFKERLQALQAQVLSPALFHQVFPTQLCDAGRTTSRIGPPGDAMWDGGVMRMGNEDGPGMPGRVAW